MLTPRAIVFVLGPVWVLAACGDTDRDDRSRIRKNRDIGNVTPTDAGAGPTGCSGNPNGCAPFQEQDDQCRCLPSCVAGFTWNAASGRCDADASGGSDAGPGARDAGPGARDAGPGGGRDAGPGGGRDAGPGGGRDAGPGAPDAGGGPVGCTTNRDCPGANGACVFVPMSGGVEACNGRMGCQCIVGCDPFVEVSRSGCASGEGCFYLGPMAPVEGACVPDPTPTAGLQNAPCSAQFDAQGNRTSQMGCNEAQNFYCFGPTPDAPTGRCGRFCDPGNPGTLCSSLGNYDCVDLSGNGTLGICLNQPSYTDIGQACMSASSCQSNQCLPGFGCSARCDGLDWCPSGSTCLSAGGDLLCFRECTSDAFCANLNPMTICETLGAAPNTVSICFPRCQSNADCPMGQTCNASTGRCR